MLQFQGRLGTGNPSLDTDLRDIQIITLPSGHYLYTASSPAGGLSGYHLEDGGRARWVNSIDFPSLPAGSTPGELFFIPELGADLLFFGGHGRLQAVRLHAEGRVEVAFEMGGLDAGSGVVRAMTAVTLGSQTIVYVADETTGSIQTYRLGANEQLQQISNHSQPMQPSVCDLQSLTLSGASFLLALDESTGMVCLYGINSDTGSLQPLDELGALEGVGIASPSAMRVVNAFGETWVVVSASGSSSLTVMRVDPAGELIATDHLVDTLHTRFGQATAITTIEVDGQVFLIAGGNDGGVSLFSLLPDGRLTLLETIVEQDGFGLQGITDIAAQQVGDDIQIFVSSAAGVSHFNISLHNQGISFVADHRGEYIGSGGNDVLSAGQTSGSTLSGGAGDDVLLAGIGITQLSGGAGADLFVLRSGGHETIITDFDPLQDRLDLSAWPMLRSPMQLTITPTSYGAVITYRDNRLILYSEGGGPIEALGGTFLSPDRILGGSAQTDQYLQGDRNNNLLVGNSGNDTIQAGGGHDHIWTRSGNDLIYAGWGFDLVEAGDGEDVIWSGDGNDTVYGRAGDDTIGGGAGHDRLLGGTGHDLIWGGAGNDLTHGGEGSDTLNGGSGRDSFWGNEGDDLILGGHGNDTLGGGTGNDTVLGGVNHDLLFGGVGHDEVQGGLGNDRIWGGDGQDILYGGDGTDALGGGQGADTLFAGAGQDTLYGGLGQDTLWGEDGNDILWGGHDADRLNGGLGADTLSGGSGDDTLIGGEGADTFVFWSGSGTDQINDFRPDEDQIVLHDTGLQYHQIGLEAVAGGVLVDYGTGTILLLGATIGSLSQEHFLLY